MVKRLMSLAAPLPTLPEIETAVWRELQAALHTRGHAWRSGVLASAVVDAAGGGGADARTVVLREVDAGARSLCIYSDARSPKVAQLLAQPQATLVLWSPALGWQLRLRVRVSVTTDAAATASRWERLAATKAAADYLSEQAPGSALPLPTAAAGGTPHFAVLTAAVQAVDWLELHAEGHRRALFDAAGGRWLAP